MDVTDTELASSQSRSSQTKNDMHICLNTNQPRKPHLICVQVFLGDIRLEPVAFAVLQSVWAADMNSSASTISRTQLNSPFILSSTWAGVAAGAEPSVMHDTSW